MSLRARTLVSLAALAAMAACSPDNPLTTTTAAAPSESKGGNGVQERFIHAKVCPSAGQAEARCHSWVRVDPNGNPQANVVPSGYGPSDLRSAYNLTSSGSSTQVIGIVDAYDDGNAESDLAVYRSQFGLSACTTANGCFRKVNQTGSKSYPKGDGGWAEEISLDLDMVSAICPNCKILLVEANSPSFANLAAAVDEAVKLGATVVSNSYGGGEYAGETTDEAHFNHPGVAITVSSGDNGYGAEFPAASRYVTAVGGTTLTSSGGSFTETVWSGAGSGCSKYVTKPTWQVDAGCGKRTVADVSAIADPNTGVAVYDTYQVRPRGGWLVFGGTSVAAPVLPAGASMHSRGGVTGHDLWIAVVWRRGWLAVRHHVGEQRLVRRIVSLHRDRGLRRPNRQRIAAGPLRLLASSLPEGQRPGRHQ